MVLNSAPLNKVPVNGTNTPPPVLTPPPRVPDYAAVIIRLQRNN